MIRMPTLPPERRATLGRALGLALHHREEAIAEYADWEAMRQRGHDIRAGAMERLDELLDQFERAATANGIRVVRAATAEEACRYVVGIAKRIGAATAVKSKSMVTEEIDLNDALEAVGVRPIETDLGEYIAQLSGQRPYHLTAPIIHLSRDEIGRVLSEKLGVPFTNDPQQLTLLARDVLRREFMQARLGISGANLVIAESGSIMLVTNEGNGRMCTTLPAREGPRVHVAVTGIEKVVPTLKDAAHLLRLLGRSSTGQRITVYTSFINGPRQRPSGEVEPSGPDEVHIVLLDNGRRTMWRDPHLREALFCIRCGACSNICPVYNRVGGHAYQSVYNGPIGSAWSPALWNNDPAATLPFASSLCGACADICPVKIDIHHALLWQRKLVVQRGHVPGWQRIAWRAWAVAMKHAAIYRFASSAARLADRILGKSVMSRMASPWTKTREMAPLAQQSFHELWRQEKP